jgi:ketosteroid isomerase-like protein
VSQENVEVVRRVYAAAPEIQILIREGGDLAAHPWISLWHPECVLEEMANVPDAATYHGREGIVRYFRNAFQDVWDEWRFQPREIAEGSNGVFVAVDNSGRSKTGVEVEMKIFQVFRFQDGMVVYATGYTDRAEALKAVGLEE